MGTRRPTSPLAFATAITLALLAASCNRTPPAAPPAAPAAVTTVTVAPRDVPISAEFVAQTQSSQAVNIQARVSGFLDKRVYTEGALVKAGQVLYQMDPKPFQAQLDAAQAALSRNQAAAQVAKANLERTKPLAQLNALSQKDLDDATGQYEQANAAVAQSQAQLEEAKLNLSYTTINSPVTGVASYSAIPEGTYVSASNAQLTTVSVLSPMWVNFSLSENEMARIRADQQAGRLKLPPTGEFDAEVVMVDGTVFPYAGKITFADPSYNTQTGTFMLRVSVPNPQSLLRPNQYVRVRLFGATRPSAILVPQRAVQQSAKGHFVWVVNKDGKAEVRPVDVGDWNGDDWFVTQGLAPGDVVIVDGTVRLVPGAAVKATAYVPPPAPARAAQTAAPPVGAAGAALAPAAATPASAGARPSRNPAGATSGTTVIDAMAGRPAQAPVAVAPSNGAAAGGLASPGTAALGSVHFATGSAAIDARASAEVAGLAGALRGSAARVAISGYTDRTGNHGGNVALARARALAVRDALVAAGVGAERIQLREPVDIIGSGTNDEARRVDVTVIG